MKALSLPRLYTRASQNRPRTLRQHTRAGSPHPKVQQQRGACAGESASSSAAVAEAVEDRNALDRLFGIPLLAALLESNQSLRDICAAPIDAILVPPNCPGQNSASALPWPQVVGLFSRMNRILGLLMCDVGSCIAPNRVDHRCSEPFRSGTRGVKIVRRWLRFETH